MKTTATAIAIALVLGFTSLASAAVSYDAAAEFSGSNPSGVWSYGHSPTPLTAADFVPYNVFAANVWSSGDTSTTLTGNGSDLILRGTSIDDAILRFTAPAAGSYAMDATFSYPVIDAGPANLHIVFGGNDFDGNTISIGQSDNNTSGPFIMNIGDTIDFAVDNPGDPVNLVVTFDFTSTVPEPASLAAFGFVGLAALARRRK